MNSDLFSLAGKRALVTGSSRGIGFAIAKGLAEHGADVVLMARSEEALTQKRQDIAKATGRDVRMCVYDLEKTGAFITGQTIIVDGGWLALL